MSSFLQRGIQWLQGLGEKIVSAPAQRLLRIYLQKKYIERYGELIDLHIDSEQKIISISLLPKGETQNIEITAKYKMQDGDDGLSVTISSVETSREWLTLLTQDYFVPHTFEDVPRIAKAIL